MRQEIIRKLFHLLGIGYLAGYACLARGDALLYVGLLGVLIFFLESLRLIWPTFNAWVLRSIGGVVRTKEANRYSGVFWTWLGCWLTMVIFVDPKIVLPAIGFFVFGDAAAALVGKAWGKRPWPGYPNKSIEGSLAFVFVSVAYGLYFLPLWIVAPAAIFTAWMETRALPWDDNVWLPLIGAVSLESVRYGIAILAK